MIPSIQITENQLYTGTINRTGNMCNAYSPFQNFSNLNKNLGNFTTQLLDFDLSHPVDLITQDSYDGSVNLILNDGKNQPRLIGSRFSIIDNKQFKIVDHSGFKDTNIYEEDTFDIDTSLKTIAQKIPVVELDKIVEFGGSLPCGAYTFYFKLADADGNESEIVAESGIIQLFIGGLTGDSSIQTVSPQSMRMGVENESTGKSITFKITNVDSGFDYIHVLYARSSSGNDQTAVDTYHKIVYDYPITNNEAIITITGNEQIIGISNEELYVDFADLQSVKTQSVVNNVLFFGNLTKKERDWDLLRRISWKIIPSFGQKQNIGSIDKNYQIGGQGYKDIGGYYNPYNVYYKTGYWPDEIYRFGVVYIFKDNSLSPVFNVPGVDFTKVSSITIEDLFKKVTTDTSDEYFEFEAEPEDYYFNKILRINSRGVIKFPKVSNFDVKGGVLYPKPLYINFDLSHITDKYSEGTFKSKEDWKQFLDANDIKGVFFVRQKRVPTILGQGLSIGLTPKDNGACPIIKSSDSYTTQSFLSGNQVLQPEGTYISSVSEVSTNALLVPDAELREATYNQLFASNSYALIDQFQISFSGSDMEQYSYYGNTGSLVTTGRKLTNVPEGISNLTDGEMYFSTLAGNPSEPYKTKDVKNVWNKTLPQDLTKSTTLIRGQWGSFVGVGEKSQSDSPELQYGHLYTIKAENYLSNEEEATSLDFLKRFNSAEFYSAICDRTELFNLNNSIDCYRGDCFISLFTHRMFRNFIDPELPTNDKIINPLCWAQNYAVRCTAVENAKSNFNVYKENEGWYLNQAQSLYANEIVQAFEVKESDEYSNYTWDSEGQYWKDSNGNSIGQNAVIGGSKNVSKYLTDINTPLSVVKPSEQEQGIGGALKSIFKSSKWALRGLASINRADVNAVGLGQWITFPICSSINIALRDIDYSNAIEQASFNKKRSFYPLAKMDVHNPLRDSNVINQAAAISLPHKHYYAMPNVPFIKQEYFTRIINSLRDSASSITNEFKVMLESAYKDYTKIYGSITKLMPLGSKMLVVFEHGLGALALNDSMNQAQNALQYLPAELSMVISTTYGSMWKDSIIETQGYIYGLDSTAKVIWRVNSECQLEIISQLRVEKFLIDNLDMSEFAKTPYIGHINIKSHYNAFKHDVIFTYYNDILYKFNNSEYDGKTLSEYEIDSDGYLLNPDGSRTEYCGEKIGSEYNTETGHVDTYFDVMQRENPSRFKWARGKSWSLCYNEPIGKFVTFYDWIPIESENIDNIWFSFDRETFNELAEKGFSGNYKKAYKPYVVPKTTGKTTGDKILINIDSSVLLREPNYPKNIIDSTFNNTCAVNYIKPSQNLTKPNQIKYRINKTKVEGGYSLEIKAGFYIGPNTNISVTCNGQTWPEVNEDSNEERKTSISDEWQLIVISSKTSDQFIDIVVTNLDTQNKGLITDAISEEYENDSSAYTTINKINKSDWDNYYDVRDLGNSLKLWKHGQAGIYDNATDIKPTHWYGNQHEFNFEFIARKDAMHKVFNNLQMISNKAEPHKFEFEVVGEAYDWHKYKSILKKIADRVPVPTSHSNYTQLLEEEFKKELQNYPKLPYLTVTDACVPTLDPQIIGEKKGIDKDYTDNTVACCLVYDKQLNEFRVHTEQLGNDVWKYGRLRGNMQYLEDLWRIEIRPVSFNWIYLDSNAHLDGHIEGINFTKIQETRHRDKYIKIKVRYTGEDLAVIQAVNTLFDYSYA